MPRGRAARAILAATLILLAPSWAAPSWAAPETSPRPQIRPDAAPAIPAGKAADGVRPRSGAGAPVDFTLDRSPRPQPRPMSSATVGVPARPVAGTICGVAGLTGRRLPSIGSVTDGCGIANAVEITAVQGVRLSMPLTMDCAIAKSLNEWVRVVVQPTFGGRVRRVDVAGAYVCRGRNNVRGAKMSEHGRGRAVDISGLTFTDGSSITVARNWNKGRDGQLMTGAYKAGCGIFGTTLGPGSDGYHEDHMHFDMPSNRRSPYCR